MQSNSQGRRDVLDPQTVLMDDTPDILPESREFRAEPGPVDDAAAIEKTVTNTFGVVTDCLRLNVRKEPSPDGRVLTIIDALSEVMVDLDASSGAFYKVCTEAGIEGFCVKKHIVLRR